MLDEVAAFHPHEGRQTTRAARARGRGSRPEQIATTAAGHSRIVCDAAAS